MLLIQAAKEWAAEHGGQMPASYPERSAFKDLLRSWQRSVNGIPLEVCVHSRRAVMTAGECAAGAPRSCSPAKALASH